MTMSSLTYSFIGNSSAIWHLKTYMRKVALTDAHVLVTGETGTGKKLAAQYIHDQSARRGKPLMAINCAALPDGRAQGRHLASLKYRYRVARGRVEHHGAYFCQR
jgi:DNA-binding NtrC family response regulator